MVIAALVSNGVPVGLPSANAEAFNVGSFACMPIASLQDHVDGTAEVKINNFSIIEQASFLHKGMTVLEVTYSVANRSKKNAHVGGQFLILENKAGGPTAAITAGPPMNFIAAGRTDVARGEAFVEPGTLKRADGVCVRLTSSL